MVYVSSEVRMARADTRTRIPVKRVENRASASEVLRSDAVVLQQRAQELWPDSYWEIEKTYSGKYVVRALESLC